MKVNKILEIVEMTLFNREFVRAVPLKSLGRESPQLKNGGGWGFGGGAGLLEKNSVDSVY